MYQASSNLYASRWWVRLAEITAEHGDRAPKERRHWTAVVLQLIKFKR
jgi:hypothetical protein